MRILVVEDDRALASALLDAFAASNFTAEAATSAAMAQDLLASYLFDAVVLDLGLPDEDGIALLRRLRASGNRVPVLVLTARAHPESRIEGLNAGADDYLGKPFMFAELKARIEAVMRRVDDRTSHVVSCGTLTYDLASSTANVSGQVLPLSPRERKLLEVMLRRKGRPVPLAVIQDYLCGPSDLVSANALEVSVHRLRKKLGQAGCELSIENVRGIGYRLALP